MCSSVVWTATRFCSCTHSIHDVFLGGVDCHRVLFLDTLYSRCVPRCVCGLPHGSVLVHILFTMCSSVVWTATRFCSCTHSIHDVFLGGVDCHTVLFLYTFYSRCVPRWCGLPHGSVLGHILFTMCSSVVWTATRFCSWTHSIHNVFLGGVDCHTVLFLYTFYSRCVPRWCGLPHGSVLGHILFTMCSSVVWTATRFCSLTHSIHDVFLGGVDCHTVLFLDTFYSRCVPRWCGLPHGSVLGHILFTMCSSVVWTATRFCSCTHSIHDVFLGGVDCHTVLFLDTFYSRCVPRWCGLPHGSVLGHILFTMCSSVVWTATRFCSWTHSIHDVFLGGVDCHTVLFLDTFYSQCVPRWCGLPHGSVLVHILFTMCSSVVWTATRFCSWTHSIHDVFLGGVDCHTVLFFDTFYSRCVHRWCGLPHGSVLVHILFTMCSSVVWTATRFCSCTHSIHNVFLGGVDCHTVLFLDTFYSRCVPPWCGLPHGSVLVHILFTMCSLVVWTATRFCSLTHSIHDVFLRWCGLPHGSVLVHILFTMCSSVVWTATRFCSLTHSIHDVFLRGVDCHTVLFLFTFYSRCVPRWCGLPHGSVLVHILFTMCSLVVWTATRFCSLTHSIHDVFIGGVDCHTVLFLDTFYSRYVPRWCGLPHGSVLGHILFTM